MQEQMTPVAPRVRAEKKHKVMFTLACVILIVGILVQLGGVVGLLWYVDEMIEDANTSESEYSGIAGAIVGLGALLIMAAGLIASNYLRDAVWIGGLVLSRKLTFSKKMIPRPMWVISLILFIFYSWVISSDVLYLIVGLIVALATSISG